MLKWESLDTTLTWEPLDTEAEWRESVLDRPKMLTLVSASSMAQAATEQATTTAVDTLTSASVTAKVNVRTERVPVLDSGQVNDDNTATLTYSVPGTDPFDFPG